ncbi:retrotransposon protein [Striga asiatica]|uniref:Retrotransposon protein n=1 Tax=Striga asiatica TaxID=4170 RepID=A0A5A7PG55_STRAF|nr:retrotransposon protein [Striga asiatica]
MIGHIEKACTLRMEDIKHKRLKEGQFGDWMRASDGLQSQNWNHAISSSAKSSSHSQIGQTGHRSTDSEHNGTTNADKEVLPSNKELILYSPPSDQAEKTLAHTKPIQLEIMPIDEDDQPGTKLTELKRKGRKGVSKGTTTWKRTPQREGRLQRNSKENSMDLSMVMTKRPRELAILTGETSYNDMVEQQDKKVKLTVSKLARSYSQSFFIVVHFKEKLGGLPCWAIFVYISPIKSERILQWEQLLHEKDTWGPVWCIAGDWNSLCRPEDKKGGQPVSDRSCWEFNHFLSQMGVQEIPLQGLTYTWANNRSGQGYVEETLDRLFVSLEWIAKFPYSKVISWHRSSSDHTMLVISTSAAATKYKKRFQFDKRWDHTEGVDTVVKEA